MRSGGETTTIQTPYFVTTIAPLHLTARVVRAPEQVSSQLDGRVVLLSIENGEYYAMNEVGSRVWVLLETPKTVGELKEILLAEFDVAPEQCERELMTFLEKLRRDHLLEIEA